MVKIYESLDGYYQALKMGNTIHVGLCEKDDEKHIFGAEVSVSSINMIEKNEKFRKFSINILVEEIDDPKEYNKDYIQINKKYKVEYLSDYNHDLGLPDQGLIKDI